MTRDIVLGAVLVGVGDAAAGELWRHPEIPITASVDIEWYIAQAQEAEARGFDFVFIVDSQYIDETFPPHHLNRLEPLTLLSAVAARTSSIGLAATISTTYSEPWDIARRLASLDLISGGRAAWNIVTSMDPGTAANFGREAHGDPAERYRRATENVRAVRGLWDSYEDDAFAREKTAERFLDPERQHRLDHEGEFFRTRGPLNIGRSRQGHPVLIQAGTSEDGRALSASDADVVFSFARTVAEAEEVARDIVARAGSSGRRRDDLRFLPALTATVADTHEEARREFLAGVESVPLERRLAGLARSFPGRDFRGVDVDAPLASVLEGESPAASSTSARDVAESIAAGRTVREHLALSHSHWAHFVGTPVEVADEIERWTASGWVDGFNYFVHTPGQWRRFREDVVSELARRGVFRASYDTDTLRGHLGLPFVRNRHTVEREREAVGA